jgi:hypothetical protein
MKKAKDQQRKIEEHFHKELLGDMHVDTWDRLYYCAGY